MKILVVHEVSYLTKVVYEFQILPEALSLLGHDVTVIDLEDSWHEERGRPACDLRPRRFEAFSRAYADARVRLRRPGLIRIPLVARVSASMAATAEIRAAMEETRFDAMLLYAVPTLGVQAVLAARERGVPVLFRAIDVSHRIVPHPILAAPTRLIEGFVYRHADAVSALTPRMKDYVAGYGVPPDRIDVLPAGVDIDAFRPGPRDADLLRESGIGPDDPVILFMGTIYRFSGLEGVIRDLPRLLDRHPATRLLIVGKGEDESRLKRIVEAANLSAHVRFTGLQPYERLPAFIRSSDVCINPFELNAITRDILPTKLVQYLACGKPLVATALPGTVQFLDGERDGVVYTDPEATVDGISALLDDPELRQTLGERARRAVEASFDWRVIARSMASWIERYA